MLNELFLEVAAVILTASVIAMVAYKLRQPLIVAYVLGGVVIGPSVLGFVQVTSFERWSSFGLALLLFTVGLNLNWRNLKDLSSAALFGGLAQLAVTSLITFGVAQLLQFDLKSSLFLAGALSLSSTAIIVKLLTDREAEERLYGRLTVALLLLQSLFATLGLLILSGYVTSESLTTLVTVSLVKVFGTVAVLWFLAKYIVPSLFRFVAQSSELMFLFALAWCFALASALQLLGFSLETSGLLAGLSLASSGFQHELSAKMQPLRDVLLVLLFVVLGTALSLNSQNLVLILVPAIIFSALVLVAYPLVTSLFLRLFGHHPRISFLTGTTLSQVGELAFVAAVMGLGAGLITSDVLAVIVVTICLTVIFSSYLITYNERVYDYLQDRLSFLRTAHLESDAATEDVPQVVLLGYDRLGQTILPVVHELVTSSVVVDFNPAVIEDLEHQGVRAIYGDAAAPEVLRYAKVAKAKMIISAIPDMTVNEDLMDYLKHAQAKGTVILTVKSAEDAARCYALGATFVIVPSVLGGEHFAQLLKKKKTAKLQWGMLGKRERQQFVTPAP